MWRLACFLAGVWPGALAAMAWRGADGAWVLAGAGAGGLLLLGLCSLLGRDTPRGVTAAAQAGWLALPMLGAGWLGLAPGPVGWAILAGVAVFATLVVRPGWSPLSTALLSLGVGAVGVPLLAAFLAARGTAPPSLGPDTAAAIFDLDARVATLPLPRCSAAPAQVEVLVERGAHPRLTLDGTKVWFDAEEPGGQRQVSRLDLASGEVTCFTCGEDGNNRRPAPSASGRAIVFDTDRHAAPGAPANTELQHMRAPDGGPRHPSRRLTFDAGRDDHVLVSPAGTLLWSKQDGGRFQVVSAAFRTGHGALLLSAPSLVASGGASWTAPLAWSPDARSLALGHGAVGQPLSGTLLDPGTAALSELGADLAGTGSVGFSADGSQVAVATSPVGGGPPSWTGFLLGALPSALDAAPDGGGSQLRVGQVGTDLAPVDLGDAADWGVPTGVSLGPNGTFAVLGQRQQENGAVRERLLRVKLDCTLP